MVAGTKDGNAVQVQLNHARGIRRNVDVDRFATTLIDQPLPGPVLIAAAGSAAADYRIGITQNNVGVDSYQTTYEKAFIAAADANADVETVVLDAGGDVARQIAQMEDLIQQEVDAIIIWPTNGEAVIPAVRKAHKAGIPVIVLLDEIVGHMREKIDLPDKLQLWKPTNPRKPKDEYLHFDDDNNYDANIASFGPGVRTVSSEELGLDA